MFHWFLRWDELSNAEARSILPGSLFIPHAMFLASPAGANSVNTRTRDGLSPLPNLLMLQLLTCLILLHTPSFIGCRYEFI